MCKAALNKQSPHICIGFVCIQDPSQRTRQSMQPKLQRGRQAG